MSEPFTKHRPLRRQYALSLALLVSTGCNWNVFGDYERDAPIRVHEATADYRTAGFGRVLTAFQTNYTGTARSIAVASAGRDSPIVFDRLWNGSQLIEERFTFCKTKSECEKGVGVGSTLIAFPHWALGTPQQQDGCVFSPGYGKSYVFCDSDTTAKQSFELDLADVVEAGNVAEFGGAGLPRAHPLGIFLLGAYQVSSRTSKASKGRVYFQPDFQPKGARSDADEVPPMLELPLRDPVTGALFADDPDAGDLGFAVAAAPSDGNALLIAVAQPARGRVIVALYDEAIPGGLDNKLSTVACLDNPAKAGSFGKRLALGDIDGDGQPEIAVGSDATNSNERVFLYRGDALPSAVPSSCPAWGAAPLEVGCSEGMREVRCAKSGFGSALAFGDVNGDGEKDLLVGAPNADVAGKSEAGAVWLFPGVANRTLLDLDNVTNLHADNPAHAHLGASLAALRTQKRDEPIAGAPGETRLFTFMCSDLEGDVSGSPLCLPK